MDHDDTGKKELLIVCELSRVGSRRVGLPFDELTAKQARATQYSGAAACQKGAGGTTTVILFLVLLRLLWLDVNHLRLSLGLTLIWCRLVLGLVVLGRWCLLVRCSFRPCLILLVCCVWMGSWHVVSTGSWTTVVSMVCRTGFLDFGCSEGHGDVSVMKGFSISVPRRGPLRAFES